MYITHLVGKSLWMDHSWKSWSLQRRPSIRVQFTAHKYTVDNITHGQPVSVPQTKPDVKRSQLGVPQTKSPPQHSLKGNPLFLNSGGEVFIVGMPSPTSSKPPLPPDSPSNLFLHVWRPCPSMLTLAQAPHPPPPSPIPKQPTRPSPRVGIKQTGVPQHTNSSNISNILNILNSFKILCK